jgi:carbonic anhydrase
VQRGSLDFLARAWAKLRRLRSPRPIGPHVAQNAVERPRHLLGLERLDEQPGVADLTAAAAAHEASQLLLGGPALPGGLLLERAEGSELALRGDDLLDGGGPERADQLVLEVGDADVEAEPLHLRPAELRAEAGPLEPAPELSLLGCVAEAGQPDRVSLRAVELEEPSDRLRASDRHHLDALAPEIEAASAGERFQRALVAGPFDEHDRSRASSLVHDGIFTAIPGSSFGASHTIGRVAGEDAFADVLAANEGYVRTFGLGGVPAVAGKGLAVLTCMDSRIEPLTMLGLAPGDAKILRNAGARVTDDVLRTLVLGTYLLGVQRVMVIAHTNCRMTEGSEENVHAAVREAGGPDTRSLAFLTTADPVAAVQADVQRIRSWPYLQQLRVGGFLYDVDTGRLTRLV